MGIFVPENLISQLTDRSLEITNLQIKLVSNDGKINKYIYLIEGVSIYAEAAIYMRLAVVQICCHTGRVSGEKIDLEKYIRTFLTS